MGGYPYESILSPEVDALMRRLGFARVHGMATPLTTGIFGSGCDEYLYRLADRDHTLVGSDLRSGFGVAEPFSSRDLAAA
jgi:hypothetical protein